MTVFQRFCFIFVGCILSVASSSAEDRKAEDSSHWKALGQAALHRAKTLPVINKPAKNVILFLGDGMGITTITASRIFAGQQQGNSGEEHQLAFEKLPWLALSKTYSANQQTPDSAPTMTAIVTGVKTNDGFLSVSPQVARGETDIRQIEAHRLTTLLEQAEAAGLATGVVTTTRVTHATPAANYAHIAERDWETDSQLPPNASVKDIAAQLIDNFKQTEAGRLASLGMEVVMGGGRSYLLPETENDPEYPEIRGKRKDGRNLIAEYQQKFGADYVWNKAQFDAIDVRKTTKLLALFEPSHMHYDFDRPQDKAGEPSLAEMTAKAIAILQNNRKGYFLMVEGGRIDHAHHEGNAYRALHDTVAFSQAVQAALDNTNAQETLIIVTADHSHTLSMAGYPKRGNPILGKVTLPGKSSPELDSTGQAFTTLAYTNGMGTDAEDKSGNAIQTDKAEKKSKQSARKTGRQALDSVDTEAPDYHQQALVPLASETHGGEDVAIFAGGPMAHLLHGVQEQSYIYYVMQEALWLK